MFARFLEFMYPVRCRPIVRNHPLAAWFSLGIFLYAIAQLIFSPPSASALSLPDWQRIAFNIVWLIGGAVSYLGINRCAPKLEASGMVLLATGLVVNFIAVLNISPQTAWSGLFTLSLAAGCARRAWVLMSTGYEQIIDDDGEFSP